MSFLTRREKKRRQNEGGRSLEAPKYFKDVRRREKRNTRTKGWKKRKNEIHLPLSSFICPCLE